MSSGLIAHFLENLFYILLTFRIVFSTSCCDQYGATYTETSSNKCTVISGDATTTNSWNQALSICQSSYSNNVMSTVTSAADLSTLTSAATGITGNQKLFIGLRREDNTSAFVFDDGTALTFSDWAAGEPSPTAPIPSCVYVDLTVASSSWFAVGCDDIVTSSSACQRDCPPDNCLSAPCSNGATCAATATDYTCTCSPGYTGTNCGQDIDDCLPWMCADGGGTCVDTGVGTVQCFCSPGYYNSAKFCFETNECSSQPCQNTAVCNNLINMYTCDCSPGWTGANCDINIDECASTPCQNGGVCNDLVNGYTCSCSSPSAGVFCELLQGVCEPGWVETVHGLCYQLLTGLMTWTQAREACYAGSTQLAIIHDAVTDAALRSLGQAAGVQFHIGLVDYSNVTGAYYWVDGTGMNYTNWIDSLTLLERDCAAYPQQQFASPTCYFSLSGLQETWDQALASCVAAGGKLAQFLDATSVNQASISGGIFSQVFTSGIYQVWLGLKILPSGSTLTSSNLFWVAKDGSAESAYVSTGAVNVIAVFDECGFIVSTGSFSAPLTVFSGSCTLTQTFICERDADSNIFADPNFCVRSDPYVPNSWIPEDCTTTTAAAMCYYNAYGLTTTTSTTTTTSITTTTTSTTTTTETTTSSTTTTTETTTTSTTTTTPIETTTTSTTTTTPIETTTSSTTTPVATTTTSITTTTPIETTTTSTTTTTPIETTTSSTTTPIETTTTSTTTTTPIETTTSSTTTPIETTTSSTTTPIETTTTSTTTTTPIETTTWSTTTPMETTTTSAISSTTFGTSGVTSTNQSPTDTTTTYVSTTSVASQSSTTTAVPASTTTTPSSSQASASTIKTSVSLSDSTVSDFSLSTTTTPSLSTTTVITISSSMTTSISTEGTSSITSTTNPSILTTEPLSTTTVGTVPSTVVTSTAEPSSVTSSTEDASSSSNPTTMPSTVVASMTTMFSSIKTSTTMSSNNLTSTTVFTNMITTMATDNATTTTSNITTLTAGASSTISTQGQINLTTTVPTETATSTSSLPSSTTTLTTEISSRTSETMPLESSTFSVLADSTTEPTEQSDTTLSTKKSTNTIAVTSTTEPTSANLSTTMSSNMTTSTKENTASQSSTIFSNTSTTEPSITTKTSAELSDTTTKATNFTASAATMLDTASTSGRLVSTDSLPQSTTINENTGSASTMASSNGSSTMTVVGSISSATISPSVSSTSQAIQRTTTTTGGSNTPEEEVSSDTSMVPDSTNIIGSTTTTLFSGLNSTSATTITTNTSGSTAASSTAAVISDTTITSTVYPMVSNTIILTTTTIDPNSCNSDPCQNNAICVSDKAGGPYTCICSAGFSGTACETKLPACYSNPCKNGGQCTGFDSFTCLCANGFEGSDCGIKSCPSNPCANGGICSAKGNSFVCICPILTSGTLCEERLPACSSNPCQYGANCTGDLYNYQCQCRTGITGDNCEININECASVICQNGGSCIDEINQYHCKCMAGSLGDFCETDTDECASSPCNNRDPGATCLDLANHYQCVCSSNYSGDTCVFDPASVAAAAQLVAPGGPLAAVSGLSKANNTVGIGALMADAVPFLVSSMPEDERMNMSWSYQDTFGWASYEDNELNIPVDFLMWNDPLLGNCFTFNHMNKSKHYMLHQMGANNGLKARLLLNMDEYASWSTTAGYRIFVHDSSEAVFMESISFEASPGYLTSIALTRMVVHRLQQPYGICTASKAEVDDYFFDGIYTKEGCIRTCYQKEVMKNCSCMDPRYKAAAGDPLCGLGNRTCIEEFNTENGDYRKWPSCVCNAPCSITDFQATLFRTGFRNLPTECDFSNITASDQCSQSYQKDTAFMEVYFRSLATIYGEETPSFTFADMLSNLGGITGVLYGLSVVTCVEFIWILFEVVFTFISGRSVGD